MTWKDIMKKDYSGVNDELEDLSNQVEEYKRLSLALGQIASATVRGSTYANLTQDKKQLYDKAIAAMKEMDEKLEEAKETYNDAIKDMAKLLGEADEDGNVVNSAQDIKDFISANL